MGHPRRLVEKVEHRPLSIREIEVLQLITEGHSNESIAATLECEVCTVKCHVRQVLRHYGVNSRLDLAVKVLKERHEREKEAMRRDLESFDMRSH